MTDLADLVIACRGGDERAFTLLVERFQDMAFAVAVAACGDAHLAQDACQDAFVTAFRELKDGRLEHPLAFPAWLKTVIVRQCGRSAGRRRPASIDEHEEDLPAAHGDPARTFEQSEERRLVHEALQALPEGQREVTALYYLSGQSTAEVAQFMQLPLTTVNKRLHDARRKLRESMAVMVDRTLHEQAPSRDDAFLTIVALCHAADIGDTARVEAIIAAKPEFAQREQGPGGRDEEKRAIHYAASAGHARIVEILLRAGADPHRGFWPYREATSPLTIARERGHGEVVAVIERWLTRSGTVSDELCGLLYGDRLDEARAKLDQDPRLATALSTTGDLPLCVAVMKNQPAMVRELVERGADVNARDGKQRDPIHFALYRRTSSLTWEVATDSEIARFLLARGARRDLWVDSALGGLEAVRGHLRRDASLANAHTGADDYPWGCGLPLTMAALGGHEAVVRALLDAGADAYQRKEQPVGEEHGLPLAYAASKGHLGIVRLLLERGARAPISVPGSPTAASLAFQNGHDEVADLLVANGDRIDFLAYARRQAYARMEQALIADPDRYKEAGWQSAFRGDERMLRIAWAFMERMRIVPSDDHLYGCLRQSLRMDDRLPDQRPPGQDSVGVFSLLAGRMTNIDHHRGDGATLLHHVASDFGRHATDDDRVAFAQALLERGARMDIRDTEHQSTALGWACRYGHAKLAAFLLARGAKANLPGDNEWNTPLAWAEKRGHAGIIALLRDHAAKEPPCTT
jgi:RNA polymerase sigma factor (sigma-70 family)